MTEKADPNTMELRHGPKPVRKLSRKAFMIASSIGVTLIIGAGFIAIKPAQSSGVERPDLYNVTTKPVADAVMDLPRNYAEIQQEELQPVLLPEEPYEEKSVSPSKSGRQAPPASQPSRTRDVRQTTRPDAGSTSGLFFNRASERPVSVREFEVPAGAPSMTAGRDDQSSTGHRLMAGSVIPASLVTGINSDLPGTVTAQVTQPLFDSLSGQHLLIPQGTRLIGRYDNQVNQGQRRIFLVWSRMIMPNGTSFELDDLAAADQAGYAGLSDRIDNHTGRLVRAGLLSTLLGVGAELAEDNDGDDIAAAIRDGLQGTANQAGQKIVERELNIPPTLTVRPGWAFQIIVTDDLVMPDYAGGIR